MNINIWQYLSSRKVKKTIGIVIVLTFLNACEDNKPDPCSETGVVCPNYGTEIEFCYELGEGSWWETNGEKFSKTSKLERYCGDINWDDWDSRGGRNDPASPVTDTITIDMSPLRVIGFSDDYQSSLYPVVRLDDLPVAETLLIRVRDPYGMGDYYSISADQYHDDFTATASPTADDGEPDNNSVEAAVLPWQTYAHRGLNPLLDEDWFSHTTVQNDVFIYTKPNMSGSGADPVLEVYDATPNLGPVAYHENDREINFVTTITGVFDPNNSLTGIGMIKAYDFGIPQRIDSNAFFLVFSGPTAPGDYPIQFAFPPVPDDLPGSVTGSIHIHQYDGVGGRIIGSFDLTIFEDSRATTVSGNFDVTREPDESGLLTGFESASSRFAAPSIFGKFKSVYTYMRRN